MNEPISLKLYGQTVELDHICSSCKGKGKIIPQIHTEDEITDCAFCDGSGYVFTDNGRELAKFIERHFKIEPMSYFW
jgi:DnaJ-class molecular chaperone